MNWEQIQGSWQQMKGKAREQWGDLTDDDLTQIAGKKDVLVGKLQSKYGRAKEDAERESDAWAASLRDSDDAERDADRGRRMAG